MSKVQQLPENETVVYYNAFKQGYFMLLNVI